MIDRNHDLNRAAWAACLMWAIGEPNVLAQFEADTGLKFTPPRNGIEAMIDKATGHQEAITRKFMEWFNKNVWGAELVPDPLTCPSKR